MTDRESEAPVGPGDVLAGKYKVERVLGVGGMGVVVQALHLELDERVAVKFLLPKSIESPEAAARFVREARAAVRIKSEHVVRVSDVGRLDDGAPYIVMEYLEGKDLSALIDDGAIAVEDAVDYVLQACVAMAEAHRLDIVHRDLKPSNLFLTRRSDGYPIVKVLDFGISKVKANDTGEAGLTKTATPMGSPYYMSPEQLRSAKDVDQRTDIWALGTILFELMTLMPPFQAETMPQLVAAILAEPPMSLEKLAPSVPAGLRAVVARCLEKDRERRYADIAALAQALAPFAPARSRHLTERLSHGAVSTSPLETSGTSATSAPEVTFNEAPARLGEELGAGTDTAWIGPQDEKPRASRKWLVGGSVAGLGLVGVLAFLAFDRAKETASPAASAVATANGVAAETAPRGNAPPVVVPDTAMRGNAPPVVVPEPDALPASPASSAPSVVPVPPVVPLDTPPLVASATPAPSHAASPPRAESSHAAAAASRPAKSAPTSAAATAPKSLPPTVPAAPVAAAAPAPVPAPAKADPEPPKPKKNPLAVDLK